MIPSNSISSAYKKELDKLTQDQGYTGIKRFFRKTVRVELTAEQYEAIKKEKGIFTKLFKNNVFNRDDRFVYFDRSFAVDWLNKNSSHKISSNEKNLNQIFTETLQTKIIAEHVSANYARILEKRQKSGFGYSDSQTVKKVVELAVTHSVMTSGKSGAVITYDNKQYLTALRESDRKLYIREITDKSEIASGSFSTAYKVRSLSSGKFKVVKEINAKADQDFASRGAKTENRVLHLLHQGYDGGKVPGIIKPPNAVVYLDPKGSEPKIGLLQRKYEGTLSTLRSVLSFRKNKESTAMPSWKEKLHAFLPVFQGMSYCARERHLIHGDIKPDNFLYEITPENQIKLYLADFGGAVLTNEHKSLENLKWMFSPAYLPEKDRNSLDMAINNDDIQEFFKTAKKSDVFALGASLAGFLAGDEVIMSSYTKKGNPSKDAVLKEKVLVAAGVPQDAIELLKKMTHSDPNQRMSMDEAYDSLSRLTSKYPLTKKTKKNKGKGIFSFVKTTRTDSTASPAQKVEPSAKGSRRRLKRNT